MPVNWSMAKQRDLMDAVCEAYDLPKDTYRRIIIDLPYDNVMTIYLEMLGDPEKLAIDWQSVKPRIVGSSSDDV